MPDPLPHSPNPRPSNRGRPPPRPPASGQVCRRHFSLKPYGDHPLLRPNSPPLLELNSSDSQHLDQSLLHQPTPGIMLPLLRPDPPLHRAVPGYLHLHLLGAFLCPPSYPRRYTSRPVVVRRRFEADQHVQSGLICVYCRLCDLGMVESVYRTVKDPDLVMRTTVVSAVAGGGNMVLARELFDRMPHRDLAAWNAIVLGYSQQGEPGEALKVFDLMWSEGVEGDECTLVSVLSACAQLGALGRGEWIASWVRRRKVRVSVMLGTAMVDMYCKCGEVGKAIDVFWKMKEKNVFTWSSMLGGLAVHGAGAMCLEYFELMKKEGVVPNEVTFVSVIRGCSMAGLVEEGEKYFDSMMNVCGLKPTHEHYGCMVDLYGRGGRMDDAVRFIDNMPIKTHVGAWFALLSACRIHKQVDLGKMAFQKIVELEPTNDAAYVLLSNIYADLKDWKQVVNIRKKMRTAGIRKEPGYCECN